MATALLLFPSSHSLMNKSRGEGGIGGGGAKQFSVLSVDVSRLLLAAIRMITYSVLKDGINASDDRQTLDYLA